MKGLLGLLLLFPAAAGAQAPQVSPKPAEPLLCRTGYPYRALRNNQTGTTTLLFQVKPNGRASGVIVAASTEDDDLDDASVACAHTWKFQPATQDGQPVEMPYASSIQWVLNSPRWRMALAFRSPLAPCLAAGRLRGVTVVSYTLTEGVVSDVSIKKSSGDAANDQKAAACVAAWRFEPETVDPDTVMTGINMRERHDDPNVPPKIPPTAESSIARHVTGTFTAKFDWSEQAP